MRQFNDQAAVLPKVEEFQPLKKVTPSQKFVDPGVVVGTGGYAVAIRGEDANRPPVVSAEVSMVGREDNGPMIRPMTGSVTGPVTGPAKETPRAPKSGGFKTLLIISLVANVALLAACAHQQVALNSQGNSIETAAKPQTSEAADPLNERWITAENQTADSKTQGLFAKLRDRVSNKKAKGAVTVVAKQPTDIEEVGIKTVQAVPIVVGEANPINQSTVLTPRIRPTREDRSNILAFNNDSGDGFIAKMRALEKGTRSEPITIVHIGDSHVASDSFSRGIRRGLQSAYGSAGRGAIVPANAFKYAVADGVKMTSSGWRSFNSLKQKTGPYGISGVRVSSSSTSARMKLTVTGQAFDWAEVTVLTGPNQGKVTISAGDASTTFNARANQQGSHVVRVKASAKSATVQPAGGGTTTVLNWATGRETPGVRYVNFGIISATAYLTRRWDNKLIANDIKHLNPDLVVFGYGTNEGFNDNLNIASYKKHVQGFVDTVSAAAPNTDWLFLGPAAGARRSGKAAHNCNGWRVPVKLGAVRSAMSDLATSNNALYWNWADAMGGPCGIDRWARSSPKLAAGDRVHLTPKGYNKSANALVSYISSLIDEPQIVALNQR